MQLGKFGFYKYEIGVWKTRDRHWWFACAIRPEAEVLYLCHRTDDPDFVHGLFYWGIDRGQMSLFTTPQDTIFAIWRTLIRENFDVTA